LFTASDSAHGTELWRSDGTAEGTVLLKDVRPGPQSTSFPLPSLFVVRDRVYFAADDGVHGYELWVSDGTDDGTHLLKDIVPGASGSGPAPPVVLGSRVVFIASDGTGLKLWTTDGTEAGTEIVTALPVPGALGPFALRDTLFFAARDDAGAEPWRTDGSPAGTGRVADLLPGGRSSSPALFGALGSVLLFSAMDDTAGRELWALDLNRPPTAQAGPDQTVEAGSDAILNGLASSDPDGDPLTYEWRDSAGVVVSTEAMATIAHLPPGVHEYSLTVGDGRVMSSDALTVTVLEPTSIVIGNARLREGGRRGERLAVFEVQLAHASAREVSVHFATQDGTAREPRDYVAASGTLHLPPGATSSTVEVTVNGDRRCEGDEVFFVVLDGAVNAVLGDSRGRARIINDDCGPHHH
jgi:ELWxxDGT repeat protein